LNIRSVSVSFVPVAVPATPRPSRTALRRAARRAELVEQLFAVVDSRLADGREFAELSVEELIVEVPLARSTFYAYFDDKSELLLALASRAFAELQQAAAVWWSGHPPADRDALAGPLREIAGVYRRHARMWRSVVSTSAYDPRVRAAYMELVDSAAADLQHHLVICRRSGAVPADLDVPRTARWLTWLIEGGLVQLVATAEEDEADRQVDALTEVVWRTLYASA
jgi:TetR/AcrR family transcriptional regulator, ethionamide resistance regulator